MNELPDSSLLVTSPSTICGVDVKFHQILAVLGKPTISELKTALPRDSAFLSASNHTPRLGLRTNGITFTQQHQCVVCEDRFSQN